MLIVLGGIVFCFVALVMESIEGVGDYKLSETSQLNERTCGGWTK